MRKRTTMRVLSCEYSVQGEGFTSGKPAVILKLGRCNLNCNSEKGMWDCDTFPEWTEGHDDQIVYIAEKIDTITPEKKENISLVVTGGEPLLSQKPLRELINRLKGRYYVEVETNGTIEPTLLYDVVDQFNVSPKLPSSGNTYDKFFNGDAIDSFINHGNAYLKFVIAKELDIDDIYNYYGQYLQQLGRHRIWLMPAGSTREELYITSPITAGLCKQYGFNFSPRLDINIYGKDRIEKLPRNTVIGKVYSEQDD